MNTAQIIFVLLAATAVTVRILINIIDIIYMRQHQTKAPITDDPTLLSLVVVLVSIVGFAWATVAGALGWIA